MNTEKIKISKAKPKLEVRTSKATIIDIINENKKPVASVKAKKIEVPQFFYLFEGNYEVTTDGQIEQIKTDKREIPEFPGILLTSDAPDVHPADGIGEIPADGSSYCTIFIKKIDSMGQPLKRDKDNDEIYVRTNNGVIKDKEGKKDVRDIKLKKGEGSFRLYSKNEKCVANIKVLGKFPTMLATIDIEFT